jgi:hypothetical protein
MYPLKLRTAICAICDGPIYVEVADPSRAANEHPVQHDFQAAVAAHFETHPSPTQARFQLPRKLPTTRTDERLAALRDLYGGLPGRWSDQDRRACYTIDEVLGTVAAYRLWLSATAARF